MIRNLILLVLCATLPTPGQVGLAALYTDFVHKPAPAVFQALREEVNFQMASDGLHFEWTSLAANDQRVWTDLAVVKFSGRCEVLPFATNSHFDQRLGWTHISNGAVLPFAEVDCDAIRAYVVKNLSLLPEHSRARVFGRAVGRVMVHELLHVFARTAAHSDHGVDHPTLLVSELLADRLDFGEWEPMVHIVHTNPAPASQTGGGSEQEGRNSYLRGGCGNCHGSHGEGSSHGQALRVAGHALNWVMLAAKLAKNQDRMYQRARNLKIAAPSVDEDEIPSLVKFLNEF
jgi:hypothetical protein